MKVIVMILLLMFPVSIFAGDMSTTTKVLTVTSVSALAYDWMQTLYIVEHPDEYSETNIFLGDHPSRGKTNIYFGSVIAATLFFAYSDVNDDLKKLGLGAITVLELGVIMKNKSIGIKASMKL